MSSLIPLAMGLFAGGVLGLTGAGPLRIITDLGVLEPGRRADIIAVSGDPLDLGRGDYRAARRRLDRGISAGVVGVPVGVPDMGDLPALVPRFAQIGLGIGRIDARRRPADRVMQQIAIIVRQARELVNFEHGSRVTPFRLQSKSPPGSLRTGL